jgi:hypothetical protein
VTQSSLATGVKPCVGVLFVHGAGDHGVGATLIEFGEPLVAWLDGWLSKGKQASTSAGDAARAGATQILVREADEHAPAHSMVSLRSKRDDNQHVWLLAEARWDQAFTPPAFRQVLLWAIGVVPWTILTQFIAPVVDESSRVRPEFFSILRFFWSIMVSVVLALVTSVILLAVAVVTVVLSIVPLDPVRDVVSKLQRFASTSVGDLYLVLTSPIQRAALASAVQRDIDWLRDQGCQQVAVVAHSQGGYVAYEALSDPWFRPVDTFITFGSGLVRLTESEQARRKGFLPVALIGVLGALIAVRFGPTGILGTFEIWEKHQANGFAFFVGFLMALGIPVAIQRYQSGREPVPDLPAPVSWTDYVTDEDPVLNGHREGRLPNRVRKIRIRNRASVIGDHGSYWQNADQFVSQVAIRIGSLDRELRILAAGPKADGQTAYRHLKRSWDRRDERVGVLQRARLPIAIATAALLAIRFDQLGPLGQQVAGYFAWVPPGFVSWLPDVLESVLPIANLHLQLVGAAVIVGLSALGYSIGVGRWEAWSRADTVRQWIGLRSNRRSSNAISFFAWNVTHLALIALVAIVGIDAILAGIAFVWEKRDLIVQAWARVYPWSLATGVAILGIDWYRTKKRPARKHLRWVLGGTSLAVVVELAIALGWPGETPPYISIPLGIVLELVGLLLAIRIMPLASRAIRFLVGLSQRKAHRPSRTGPFATRLDRLGVIGVIVMWTAAALVVQPPLISIVTGTLLAFVALVATALLATNDRVRELPKFLKPKQPSPFELRVGGWAAAATSVVLLGIGLVRGVAVVVERLR